MSVRKTKREVKKAAHRSIEHALQEERLALTAITKVMLLEVDDPMRVLARLDAMARAAESNKTVSAAVRRRLIDATRYVRAAVNAERKLPPDPGLFDPPGVVPEAKVAALVKDTDGPQQLGLEMTESLLGDVEQAHAERVNTLEQIHEAVLDIIRGSGAMTEVELHEAYTMRRVTSPLPPQTRAAIMVRRRELAAGGRLVKSGTRGSAACWDVVERAALGSVA